MGLLSKPAGASSLYDDILAVLTRPARQNKIGQAFISATWAYNWYMSDVEMIIGNASARMSAIEICRRINIRPTLTNADFYRVGKEVEEAELNYLRSLF